MQKNNDIGKIQTFVPIVVDRIIRRFIAEVTHTSALYAIQTGKTGQNMNYKLTREHVRLAIDKTPKYRFMKKVVEDVPLM